jgi:hypothetical protein
VANCSDIIFGSLPHTIVAHSGGFHVVDSLCVAKAHALRVSMTQIAFKDTAAIRTPSHCAKGTGGDTHPAPDTEIMVDPDAFQFFIAINGIFGACGQAGSIFALPATQRYIDADIFPFDNSNSGQGGVAHPKMPYRANHFAIAATRTFFRVNLKYFVIHYYP